MNNLLPPPPLTYNKRKRCNLNKSIEENKSNEIVQNSNFPDINNPNNLAQPELKKLKKKIKGDKTSGKDFSTRVAKVVGAGNLVNFYEMLPDEYKPNNKGQYPNFPNVQIKLPCQMVVAGKTGGGKTNIVMNFLSAVGVFTKVFLCVKNPTEPLYKFLIDKYTIAGNKAKEQAIWVFDEPSKLPDIMEFGPMLNGQHGILIVDDFVNEEEKDLKGVMTAFGQGRKQGNAEGGDLSVIFISQDFFGTPKFARKQASLLELGPLTSVKDLKRIVSEYALDMSPEDLSKLHQSIQAQGTMNFLTIDMTKNSTTEKHLKYRKNFEVNNKNLLNTIGKKNKIKSQSESE